ncbi:hypothetical protein DFQ26_006554 [Actinomortierella ambigua]|nr:hypothetical protein DFQ26_006554 [Actinomortierella ambigua]
MEEDFHEDMLLDDDNSPMSLNDFEEHVDPRRGPGLAKVVDKNFFKDFPDLFDDDQPIQPVKS